MLATHHLALHEDKVGHWDPGPPGRDLGLLQQSRGCKHLVPRSRSAASPGLLSPDSLTLSASSALASRQRRLLKSGWTLPGEARAAEELGKGGASGQGRLALSPCLEHALPQGFSTVAPLAFGSDHSVL